tara:strand:+ start:535 stop:1185 length:651 start_codon:yes stop_codon:yes gene_type:complete
MSGAATYSGKAFQDDLKGFDMSSLPQTGVNLSANFKLRHLATLAELINKEFKLQNSERIDAETLNDLIKAGRDETNISASEVTKILNDVTAHADEEKYKGVSNIGDHFNFLSYGLVGAGVFAAAVTLFGASAPVGLACAGVAIVTKSLFAALTKREPNTRNRQVAQFQRELSVRNTLKELALPFFERELVTYRDRDPASSSQSEMLFTRQRISLKS